MKRKLLKDVVTTLLPILFCFTLSCNDANNGINTNSKFDTSKQVVPAPADTVHSLTSKKDTIYTEIYLEDSLKNYGHFGATISEWNKRLAILAQDGIVRDLEESSGVYKGFIKFSESSGGFYITGKFRFPRQSDDTVEYFMRNNIMLHEGVLIGIQLETQIRDEDIEPVLSSMIGNDDLKYLAGYKIPAIKLAPPVMSDFGYRVGEAYNESFLANNLGESPANGYHDINANSSSSYLSIYEGRLFYSVFYLDENITGTLTCFCSRERSETPTYNSSTGRNEYKDYLIDRITSIRNLKREYGNLTQTIWSKKQAGIRVENFYTVEQKAKVSKQSKTESLIDKALSK